MEASSDLTKPAPPSPIPQPAGQKSARIGRPTVFVIFAILLTAAFGRSLFSLVTDALNSELNSYIVLIPFVSLYLLYLDRDRLPATYQSSPGWAAIPFAVGAAALVFVAAGADRTLGLSTNDRLSVITLAFVSFLWSGGYVLMGREWMGSAAFPIFFLVFLVPLPDRLVYGMELGLRYLSADAANVFFALSQTPVLRTGTVFQLPGFTLEVAQECSGIRSSWVLFITSLVAAQLFLTKRWSKLILVAAVIPLGIIRNGFRIMVIGLLCIHVGPEMINSPIHRRGGPIFFALSLIPLLLLLWFLRKRELAFGNQPAGVMPGRPGG